MDNRWIAFGSVIFDWLMLSIALTAISGKLRWDKKWKAWIPGLRMYMLGTSLGLPQEGTFCAIMDLMNLASAFSRLVVQEERISVLAALIQLIMVVFYVIYRIRIFLQIMKLFGLKKRWMVLWLIIEWLPLLLLGTKSKYQPKVEGIAEESWLAGHEPAQIAGVQFLAEGVITPWGIVDIGITILLVTYAADIMALMVSCIVRTTTTAMTVMPC